MQTSHQPSIFDLIPEAATTAPRTTAIVAGQNTHATAPLALKFVTDAQLQVMRSSPYASLLRGKSLEEIRQLDNTIGNALYKKSDTATGERRLAEWRTTADSARTIALEAEYRKIDERFCFPERGIFYLVGKDNTQTAVGYKYEPFYFDSNGNRTSMPVHHLEFRSEGATEISETGYRSHFLTYVPFSEVDGFADFIVKILRVHLNVKATIIFDGQNFAFDPAILPAPKKKAKKTECHICGEKLDKDGGCPDCAGFDYEGDEGDDSEDFEDLFEDLDED